MKYEETYQSMCTSLAALTERIKAYDRLHAAGLSYELAAYMYIEDYAKEAYSGYTMGERVSVYCGKALLLEYENTREYARSCKWRARHGRVVFRFTRKALREYAEMCKACNIARETEATYAKRARNAQADDIRESLYRSAREEQAKALASYDAIKKMLAERVDEQASDIKAGSHMFF